MAPSNYPTDLIHPGNSKTALINLLNAPSTCFHSDYFCIFFIFHLSLHLQSHFATILVNTNTSSSTPFPISQISVVLHKNSCINIYSMYGCVHIPTTIVYYIILWLVSFPLKRKRKNCFVNCEILQITFIIL